MQAGVQVCRFTCLGVCLLAVIIEIVHAYTYQETKVFVLELGGCKFSHERTKQTQRFNIVITNVYVPMYMVDLG